MRSRRGVHIAILALAIAGSGCGTGLLPPEWEMEAGSRTLVIPVANNSRQVARLFVGADTAPAGDVVGRADPSEVPPGETVDVTFVVPPGRGWAIFVNATAQRGPLITAADVPLEFQGETPLRIGIEADGEPTVMVPSEPGWFGQ